MTGHPAEETDALIRKAASGHSRAAADARRDGGLLRRRRACKSPRFGLK